MANLQALLNLDELSNAIGHLFGGLVFGQAQTALVRDVIDASNRFRVFAGCAAHLQIVFASDFFQLGVVLGQIKTRNELIAADCGTIK